MHTTKKKKLNPFYRKKDIRLYIGLLIFIALLFILPFALKKDNGFIGFDAYIQNNRVLTYCFSTNEYDASYSAIIDVETTENGYIFTIFTNDLRDQYNKITVDRTKKEISVTDSNCSSRQDCVHTASIKDGTGFIVCQPHNLKICATGAYLPLVTG